MEPFRKMSGEIIPGTHSRNWLRDMAHKMHLGTSKMYYTLFNGFLERLNADCLPPSFKLDQTDGEFLLEPLPLIWGDAINVSLWLVSDPLRISQAPGGGFCLSIL
jgi:hypothetical protein